MRQTVSQRDEYYQSWNDLVFEEESYHQRTLIIDFYSLSTKTMMYMKHEDIHSH
jgi:hypothetical protein